MYRVHRKRGQGFITLGVMSLKMHFAQLFYVCGPSSMKLITHFFITDFYKPKKARKLKVPVNMDNDGMYRIYQNRGKGFIILGDVA